MDIALKIILITLGVIIGLILLVVLVFFGSALFVNPKKEYVKPNKYYAFVLEMTHRTLFTLGNIRVKTVGKEKLPSGRFLLVSNHRSAYDPLCTWVSMHEREITFISKEENLKKPFIGRWGKRLGCLPIDREDPRKAIKTINRAAELIAEDKLSMGVYPEGTRSVGAELLDFHNAVFKIAQKAKVPIVVMAIDGSEKIKKRFLFRRTNVYITIADVIDTEFVINNGTKEIGERAKNSMINALSNNKIKNNKIIKNNK